MKHLMNVIGKKSVSSETGPSTTPIDNNLSQLYREARQYGLVYLHNHTDGTYTCIITFNTIKHTELKASSGHGIQTPEEAVALAIAKAKEIVASISKLRVE